MSALDLWDSYRNDTFLIVGFTELTGRSVAELFEERGLRYRVSDLRSREELAAALTGLRIDPRHVFIGAQTPGQLAGITGVILSPGVPRSIPLVRAARERGIPVWGDVDFLHDHLRRHGTGVPRTVAITGTDGKTTTTLLTGAILGRVARTVVAGNVGEPVFSRYRDILAADWLVLEMSSFMLEEIRFFRPDIAAITNVAEDHVDRYGSFSEYLDTKLNIVRHCRPDDLFIQNLDDPHLRSHAPTHLRVRTVSAGGAAGGRSGATTKPTSADYSFSDGCFKFGGATLPYAGCRLRGSHNAENILLALAVATEVGVSPGLAADVVRDFGPVPHRFEYLGSYGGVEVYNDSKATTVHAIERALDGLAGNVVLIVGGRSKGLDFTPLKKYQAGIKLLMCYGEAGEEIRDRVGHPCSEYTYGFAEAVTRAMRTCTAGDTLLLSPGCTSWDQHVDYQERGAEFRELVHGFVFTGGPGRRRHRPSCGVRRRPRDV